MRKGVLAGLLVGLVFMGMAHADVFYSAGYPFSLLGGTATDAQIPDTITITQASTATALAGNGSDCPSNQVITGGVDASGNAVGCSGSPTLTGLTLTSLTLNGSTVSPILSGTTDSIGGSQLGIAGCTSGTVAVTGATTAMVAVASPNTYPGDGILWDAQVTSAGNVTVKVCAIALLTPTSSTYNVRVLQ